MDFIYTYKIENETYCNCFKGSREEGWGGEMVEVI
jgi:hypothetical protein